MDLARRVKLWREAPLQAQLQLRLRQTAAPPKSETPYIKLILYRRTDLVMADQAPAGEPSSSSAPPACFLIVYGVAKKHNIGTLLRCATAFGVKQVGFAAVACLS